MCSTYIKINCNSPLPIYRQIEQSVVNAVESGKLNKGDRLPSINVLANAHSLSRDTVLMAYSELKNRGIVISRSGKGYYLATTRVNSPLRVLLLFDELNAFKEDLYNSFVETLGGLAEIDIFFHHFNSSLFKSIVRERKDQYTYYVIMPANLKGTLKAVQQLPPEKVFILDQMPKSMMGIYPGVYQLFSEDIYAGLKAGLQLIKKYKGLTLVFPGGKEPVGFLEGFKKFCVDYHFTHYHFESIKKDEILSEWVYILMDDRDLVHLVKHCKAHNLILGKDIGVISLNDTGLKEIVADGITTISTDFKFMGERIAQMVLSNQKDSVKNPSRLIVRNSL